MIRKGLVRLELQTASEKKHLQAEMNYTTEIVPVLDFGFQRFLNKNVPLAEKGIPMRVKYFRQTRTE